MLRITRVAAADTVTLRLEGKLLRPWVAELSREWDIARVQAGTPGRVVFDLTSLTFLDDAGAELVRDLLRRGATVTGYSRFVSDLLDGSRMENR